MWTGLAGSATRNLRLVARRFLRGATIEVRCSGGGCPRSSRRVVRRASENLQRVLGKRVLRRGARLEVRVTSASRIGRLLRFRFSRPGQPDVDFLCLPPGVGTREARNLVGRRCNVTARAAQGDSGDVGVIKEKKDLRFLSPQSPRYPRKLLERRYSCGNAAACGNEWRRT